MTQRLSDPAYLAFPLRIGSGSPRLASRAEHVRGQILQVLFTLPGERVFRPEFGAGIRALVFEPNSSATWQVTRKRLLASLAEALQGEVDPKSIEVEVSGDESTLEISVSYVLAAVGQQEKHRFSLGKG